eukprot:TRINITY_DN41358_c0_g1_i1.p1 TRINITY_DN41358_c0_g1~~TRINITY_DN41358_c0_g1_i1.p1  ORF type:complete len:391 (-),score=93.89 TRINITY_DN41358_c0_g1_i1:32-1204(-)
MRSFDFYNPVEVIFGEDRVTELAKAVPKDAKVLLTFGQGSIKRNGTYDKIISALEGHTVIPFGGIEPNPEYDTLMKAVDIAKKEDVDFVLAVGGGSVIDGSKFITAAARLPEGEDPFSIMKTVGANIKDAIPLGVVLTVIATGSENNMLSVVSRRSQTFKGVFRSRHVFPKFCILDPVLTYSLPPRQIGNGVVDAFVHVLEAYLTGKEEENLVQIRYCEGILKTLLEVGPLTLKDPSNYHHRANWMFCASQALNGLLGCGVEVDWATHRLGVMITAACNMDHGATLAVLGPIVYRHRIEYKEARLVRMLREVFGVQGTGTRRDQAEQCIQCIEKFYHAMGLGTKLTDYSFADRDAVVKSCIEQVSKTTDLALGEGGAIKLKDAIEIFNKM